MRYVSTKHNNSCGIASIAMITGIGYDKIRDLIVPENERRGFKGTSLEKTLKTFSVLNKKFKISFNKVSLLQIKNNAYISIYVPDGRRHAIIWNAKTRRIMDPSKFSYISKDYVRKNLNFIIEILE